MNAQKNRTLKVKCLVLDHDDTVVKSAMTSCTTHRRKSAIRRKCGRKQRQRRFRMYMKGCLKSCMTLYKMEGKSAYLPIP